MSGSDNTNRNIVKEGDYALIYLKPRKTWLVKIQEKNKIHTHAGYLDGEVILGKEYGSRIVSSTGNEFVVLRPIIVDYLMKASRPTQIVYPKDLGVIAAWTGLSPGQIVVEAGTGRGSLTCFAANLVRPEGHVYSYEKREEFMPFAKKNIERSGLSDYVTLIHGNAAKGVDQREADVSFIDVGDPWLLVGTMKAALRGGGTLASISPTVNQVEKVTTELIGYGFVNVETIEIMHRNMEIREGMSRPSMRMVGHTAYLTFARKALG